MQIELKPIDKITDQLLKLLSCLTNFEFETKNKIIHKSLDQTNDGEKKKSIRRQNDINIKLDVADNKSGEKDNFDSTKETKEHAERNKANNSSNNTEFRNVKPKTNKKKKVRVRMLNGIQEKGLNKNANINIKIGKYPGLSSTEILDYMKSSLRIKPDRIVMQKQKI